jgi:tetratricopeptide (TPR) repeat protein
MSKRTSLIWLALLAAVAAAAAATTYRLYTTRAGYLLNRGRSALERGNWSQADHCLELLEMRGYEDHARLLRGQVWLYKARLAPETSVGAPSSTFTTKNSFRLALHELAQIRHEEQLASDAAVLGAECLVHLGERRFAAEVLHSALQQNPDHLEAHRWLAAIYIDLNSPSQAITHLREWARLDPHNGRPYRWIGWFLAKDYDGKVHEAIEAYQEACRRNLEPTLRAEVVKELVGALVDGPADYEGALETLARNPEVADQPEVLALRAQCLWSLARRAEATQAVENALQAHPQTPRALQLRAKMFLADAQPKATVPLLEKALAVDAHDPASRQLLMQAYRQLGDPARAEQQRRLLEESRGYKERLNKLHQEALRYPWDANVRNQLADLCLQLNLKAEAQMWRQAALACTANPPSARRPRIEGGASDANEYSSDAPHVLKPRVDHR